MYIKQLADDVETRVHEHVITLLQKGSWQRSMPGNVKKLMCADAHLIQKA